FHTHPIGLAAIGALVMLTLALRPFAPHRRWCLRALPIIAIGTIPWLAIASRGYSENTFVFRTVDQLPPRFAQFAIEFASVTPLVGIVVLFALLMAQARRRRAPAAPVFSPGERWLVVVLVA